MTYEQIEKEAKRLDNISRCWYFNYRNNCQLPLKDFIISSVNSHIYPLCEKHLEENKSYILRSLEEKEIFLIRLLL